MIFTLRLATCRQKTLSHFKPSEASFKRFYFCSPKSECPRFFYFKKIPAFPKSHSPIDLKNRKKASFLRPNTSRAPFRALPDPPRALPEPPQAPQSLLWARLGPGMEIDDLRRVPGPKVTTLPSKMPDLEFSRRSRGSRGSRPRTPARDLPNTRRGSR